MSAWERWAKRIFKGVVWVFLYLLIAYSFDVPATWQVSAVVVLSGLTNDLLDLLLPTDAKASP
jgi:hypothetical protein